MSDFKRSAEAMRDSALTDSTQPAETRCANAIKILEGR